MEDLLLKCDIHNNEKVKMFCQNHNQLCCSECVLLNHRQCTNLVLSSESVQKLSVDMQQLSNKIQTILDKLNKFKRIQEASIQSVEGSYGEKLEEIRELRTQLNAALDEQENTTMKEMDEIRLTLQASLQKDIDNCSRLKDELQQLGEAVQGLHNARKKETEFIASRKFLDKIQECESFLKENTCMAGRSIIFQANTDIVQYLSKQSSLGRVVDSMQSFIPDQEMTVTKKCQYNVNISKDTSQSCLIRGICSLPSGAVVIADYNKRVKLLDKHCNVSSHCDVSGSPLDICQITSSEVAVTLGHGGVQFVSVTNGQLVNGNKLQLPHVAVGIAHHRGKLYITSGTALFHYTLTGTLVKKLYENTEAGTTVYKCAVSPAGDKIYVTNYNQHKVLTLATDGSLISTFTDPELQGPWGVHVTPSGQVLVCGYASHTVVRVNREGRKKLSTLATQKDGLNNPMSVCYNIITNLIIVDVDDNIIVMNFQWKKTSI
ncbi:uncharacterized protein LOC127858404 [Dreissena polymorpha]|uniref:B box-type domain-containing protein n=1 Tax=Dreissena polymorpha TaxID=45954 RepID=A0A9D4BVE0_DREPO|nr:uncharacterized protein LOC127858404 [Dreissena polymorpha]KAH3710582.1 hypothetical protein DPMN_070069 [Dreissena polymorpha]